MRLAATALATTLLEMTTQWQRQMQKHPALSSYVSAQGEAAAADEPMLRQALRRIPSRSSPVLLAHPPHWRPAAC